LDCGDQRWLGVKEVKTVRGEDQIELGRIYLAPPLQLPHLYIR
jgi:hypothetical protein